MPLPALRQSARNNIHYICVTSLYALVMVGASLHFGATFRDLIMVFFGVLVSFCSLLFILPLGNMAVSYRALPKDMPILRRLLNTIKDAESLTLQYFKTQRGYDAIVLLGCTLPFFFSFIIGKSLIPFFHAYSLDPFLSHLDKIIHFGYYPHQILPQINLSYHVTESAEYAYLAWFLVLPACNGFAILFDNNVVRRNTYLWTSFFMWVWLGNILAAIMSSVGPVFYGHFFNGDNPYASFQNDITTAVSHGLTMWPDTVALLLSFNQENIPCNLNAISAFPSMHVGASMLACLYGFSISRALGIFAGAYTLTILSASIILGMHYAVDGYASILGVTAIWFVLRWILNRKLT